MKVGILTSGGDAPGMNAAIRSCVRSLIHFGHQVFGISRGFQGIFENEFSELHLRSVANVIHRGGTTLKTSRYSDFLKSEIRLQCMKNLRQQSIERLIVIGGNGSYLGAEALYKEHGLLSCCIPATIDNDVQGTEEAIGFDTALNTAIWAIDKIRDTANSHDRLFIVEVMGRDCEDLPLAVALSCGAEAFFIHNTPKDLQHIHKKIYESLKKGKKSSIVIVAENDKDALHTLEDSLRLENLDFRSSILGHIQRGGAPTGRDRLLASQMGFVAAQEIANINTISQVGLLSGKIEVRPFEGSRQKNLYPVDLFTKLSDVLSK